LGFRDQTLLLTATTANELGEVEKSLSSDQWCNHQNTNIHPFFGLLSRTTSVNQKGRTVVDFNSAMNYVVLAWQWHLLYHVLAV